MEHWYKRDGSPCYTIVGANGKERDTTLRDAKKLGLLPSVTTIMKCAHKEGLVQWMIEQAILAALTCPRIDGEEEASYLSRIKQDAQEQAKKAAERGTQIHGWVEDYFNGIQRCKEAIPFYESVDKSVYEATGEGWWKVETSFATNRYGGKCDLCSEGYIIDFKTTDKDISTLKLWPEHYQQLAAYREGLKLPQAQCGILYISSVTAESRLIIAEEKELVKGIKCFNALTEYFYAKSGLEEKNG